MAELLTWGIIGTGGIARTFAKGLLTSKTGELVAVASRRLESAQQFGGDFLPTGDILRLGSYEDLLACPRVRAVYIATPHPLHAIWAVRAAQAGKHVLCEKPLTLNFADAMQVMEAPHEHSVPLMEAFMYRCHPLLRRLVDLLREKAIGDVRMIQAFFGFQSGLNYEKRLLNNELGGGGILDVGCYPVSLARLVAGVAAGQEFLDPVEVRGCGHVGARSRVDEYALATLKFPNDIVAGVGTAVQCNMDNGVRIYGSTGKIHIPELWVPSEKGNKIIVHRYGKDTQEIVVEAPANVYTLEADTFAAAVQAGKREAAWPAMRWKDTLGNMKTLDQWRAAIGVVYENEKPPNRTLPIDGRPLCVRKDQRMEYGAIPGVSKPVSRLVMGVDKVGISNFPMAAAMFDDYFQRGGNAFDSAYIYGGDGGCEKALGHWIKSRNIREKVVLLDKGAHTPNCYPEALTRQLLESLRRLQTDYVDIYMMHRDNPDVPVDEFVEVLNEHKRAGRISAFGGSNWTLQRLRAFNDYASAKGLTGFCAVSNNFSLARMIQPPWGGCVASSDGEWRVWLEKEQFVLMPWSSQARGFFTDRAAPDQTSDQELARCWYSPDNFQRQQRARELAKQKEVAPIVIALAYVLCQPFPTFPLIGPAQVEETRSSFEALQVKLTPDELKWLNLEA